MQSVFVGFLLVFVAISALPQVKRSDDDSQKLKTWDKTCEKESGFNSSYPMDFYEISQNEKCYLACLLEQEGVLRSNGTIDLDTTKTSLVLDSWADGITEKFLKTVEECVKRIKIIPDDNCENAYFFILCIKNKVNDYRKN